MSTRRQFLQAGPALLTAAGLADADQNFPPSDRIRIATIGFGGMGMGDTKYALAIPGVELVAVCDIYDGRLIRSCPRGARGWGLHDTRLSRSARPQRHRCGDHCHTGPLACDALDRRDGGGQGCLLREADGAVGWRRKAVIAAQERTGRIFQVGSQYVTSAVYQKAREFVQSGAIGRLTMVEAWLDRNTALGAWQYSIPPDSIGAFPKAVQEEFMRQYRQQYPAGGSRPRRSSRRGSRPHPGMTPTRSTTGFSTKPCAAARSR